MVEWFRGPTIKRYKGKTEWSVNNKNLARVILKLFREGRTEVVIEEETFGGFQTVTGYMPTKNSRNEGEGSGRRRLHPIELR